MVSSPEKYTAVIAEEAGEGLFARLSYMLIKPAVVLDVGCGLGKWRKLLQQQYPEAQIIGDESLPLQAQSVDMVFANLFTPWHMDFAACLREWRRVLRPEGLLIFSGFGRDTLHELAGNDQIISAAAFVDMHDVGDALLKAGFADPVLDVEYVALTYRTLGQMLQELQATNMLAMDISTAHLQHVQAQADNLYHTTYELFFAHCFVPSASAFTAEKDGVTRIPLAHLRASLLSNKDDN